jgi:hypothetical protein
MATATLDEEYENQETRGWLRYLFRNGFRHWGTDEAGQDHVHPSEGATLKSSSLRCLVCLFLSIFFQ